MKRLRVILIPFGMLLELTLLAIGLVLMLISARHYKPFMDWVFTWLPTRDWYFGD